MDLIKCPYCGEEYSPSYRNCPFCEEEGYSRRTPKHSSRHVSEKKHTHSARGPLAVVLVVVLAVFSWYLFGGKLMEKLRVDDVPPTEQGDPQTPSDPIIVPDEPDVPDDGSADDPAPPDDGGTDEPTVPDEPDDPAPPEVSVDPTPAVDPAKLSMKTNVGSLSKAPGTDSYDCSITTADTYIKLIVQGTDAQVSWSSANTSVVTVAADGTLKPLKAGTTTVTASVGGATLECIVRIR